MLVLRSVCTRGGTTPEAGIYCSSSDLVVAADKADNLGSEATKKEGRVNTISIVNNKKKTYDRCILRRLVLAKIAFPSIFPNRIRPSAAHACMHAETAFAALEHLAGWPLLVTSRTSYLWHGCDGRWRSSQRGRL